MKKLLLGALALAATIGAVLFIVPLTKTTTPDTALAMPKLSVKTLEHLLETQTFSDQGFSIEKSAQSFTLQVTQEEKVRHFLVTSLNTLIPTTYAPLVADIKAELSQTQEKLFEGLTFDMHVVDTPESAKLVVVLKKLPASLIQKLPSHDARIIQALLDKGALGYTLWLDEQAVLRGIELNNLDETWSKEGQTTHVRTQDTWARFQGSADTSMQVIQGMKELHITMSQISETFSFILLALEGTSTQTDPFNSQSKITLEALQFHAKNDQEEANATLKNIQTDFHSEVKAGFINSDAAYRIAHTEVVGNNGKIRIEDFVFMLSGNHISHEAMLSLAAMNATTQPELAEEAIEKMLQSGLTFEIQNLSMKTLSIAIDAQLPAIEVRNFKFDLHAQLKENSLNLNDGNALMYLPFIALEGKLELNSADLDKLISLNPMLGMLSIMKKSQGDQAVFEYAFKGGQILINGQPLPF